MVLRVVNSKGHVISPTIFLQGLRINASGYNYILKTFVKCWSSVFQKDSETCHNVTVTQDCLSENFYNQLTLLWTHKPPDLNYMGCYV